MRYAFVQNGLIIDGPRALPQSWGNISGFSHMHPDKLQSLGWIPWIYIETPLLPTEVVSGHSVSIFPTYVRETRLVRPKTPEEILDEHKSFVDSQRRARELAYATEADPLFFKAQRGEISLDIWKNKVADIRARYPYGDVP